MKLKIATHAYEAQRDEFQIHRLAEAGESPNGMHRRAKPMHTRKKRISCSIVHSNFLSPRTRHSAAPSSEHHSTCPPQMHNKPRSVMLCSIALVAPRHRRPDS